jgi:NifU-like protein involved in Fe-S cluster formation
MDQSVIKYYRKIVDERFPHAGSLEGPDIFLDAVGEHMRICDHVGTDSLRLYARVQDDRITQARYLCSCDPTTNVAVEIMSGLIEGKALAEIATLTPESFSSVLGNESKELTDKSAKLIELLGKGIERYREANQK